MHASCSSVRSSAAKEHTVFFAAFIFSLSGLGITLSGLMLLLFDFSLDELSDRSHGYMRVDRTDADEDEDILPASGSASASTSSGTNTLAEHTSAPDKAANLLA